jgi:hypothetical protein
MRELHKQDTSCKKLGSTRSEPSCAEYAVQSIHYRQKYRFGGSQKQVQYSGDII